MIVFVNTSLLIVWVVSFVVNYCLMYVIYKILSKIIYIFDIAIGVAGNIYVLSQSDIDTDSYQWIFFQIYLLASFTKTLIRN